jgi:hypothetical protein
MSVLVGAAVRRSTASRFVSEQVLGAHITHSHRRLRFRRCRCRSDNLRTPCIAGKVSRPRISRRTCPGRFFLLRGSGYNFLRRGCRNQGRYAWPYYTLRQLGQFWPAYTFESKRVGTLQSLRHGAFRNSGFEFASALNVTRYVKDDAIRIDYKEASNSPRFVSKRVSNLKTAFDGTRVDCVDILDLDRDIRHQC